MLTKAKREFITFMMGADVLRFGEFVTKSGRKTPYFVNTGNYRTGAQIAALGDFYAALVHETLGDAFDCMFGPAYKGIPLATAAAGSLFRLYGVDKPFCFNRKERKDVITAGTAVRETLPVLQGCGDVQVKDMFISVNRCEVGKEAGKTAVDEVRDCFGIQVHALVTVRDIREYLGESGMDAALLAAMDRYMSEYCVF